jgi:hypothetical protein
MYGILWRQIAANSISEALPFSQEITLRTHDITF